MKPDKIYPSTPHNHTSPQLCDWCGGGAVNVSLALCLRVKVAIHVFIILNTMLNRDGWRNPSVAVA